MTSQIIAVENGRVESAGLRGSHLEFRSDDALPFKKGRFLGRGVNGDVLETQFNGMTVAWKTILCRTEIGRQEKREIEVLKRLRHRHIIDLVGTYTHGRWLGLLLSPVATCDLAQYLEDVETLRFVTSEGDALSSPEVSDALERMKRFGTEDTNSPSDLLPVLVPRLKQSFGCIVNAVEYLHQEQIRHKDLKPANILLSADGGLWITDFGKATDFSEYTESATNGGDRGTPKYFAPEVATFEYNGRSADIFSLGCIFLEMLAVCLGTCSLNDLKKLRPKMDQSFQANISEKSGWFSRIEPSEDVLRHLVKDVMLMLEFDPDKRPTALQLKDNLFQAESRGENSNRPIAHGKCCAEHALSRFDSQQDAGQIADSQNIPPAVKSVIPGISMTIEVGNTSSPKHVNSVSNEPTYSWTFFVRPTYQDVIQLVEVVPFELDSKDPAPRVLLSEPPFQVNRTSQVAFRMKTSIVLKAGYLWQRREAKQLDLIHFPGSNYPNRILTFTWLLDLSGSGTKTKFHERVDNFAVRG